MSTTTRLLLTLALGGAITLSDAAPAAAKAFSLDKVQITGPGLNSPITLSGRELRSPQNGHLFITLLPRGLSGQTATATTSRGWKGPRYRVDLHLGLHLIRRPRSVAIHQHLYPYALGGPVTFTPPGQSVRIVPRSLPRVKPGWELASILLVERLQRLGLPPAPERSGHIDVARDVHVEGLPWAAAAGSIVLGAGLLLMGRLLTGRPLPIRRRRGSSQGQTSF
jgi:hypothetical protein